MNVVLSFDVEIWCNGWNRLDAAFPSSYERYVYGRSPKGEYALPKTLEILARNGLRGVFFVEPLFSARFGAEYLERIVHMIVSAGQEVQLHLHPEWTDEIRPPILEGSHGKRQHLIHYSADEQASLIGIARRLLEAAGSGPLTSFRAGSYAVNRATYGALRSNGIRFDSSLNRCHEVSGRDLRDEHDLSSSVELDEVLAYPVSVFKDGLGRLRPAQVGACSAAEMRQAMWSARALEWQNFIIVSHNFELLRTGSTLPDPIVVSRFEKLCRFLSAHPQELPVTGFANLPAPQQTSMKRALPQASIAASARRHAEQALRRLY